MFRTVLLTAACFLCLLVSVRAQATVRVIDSLRIRTDDARDNAVPPLRYGFGSDYTDGPDTANGRGEFPFPFIGGPGGFACAWYVRDFQGDPAYDYRDIRGLPDSISSQSLTHFSLTYIMRLQAGIGHAVVQTWGSLARGLDSVVLRSTQPGANYEHVFYPVGGIDTLPYREITELEMVAYFDYQFAASTPTPGSRFSTPMFPNPVRSGDVVTFASVPYTRDVTVTLSDLLGRRSASFHIGPGSPPQFVLGRSVCPGRYTVHVDHGGEFVASGSLVVIE